MSAKKFGFGLMRLPLSDKNDSTTVDIEQTKKMVDLFLERGFTYFDTAWMYHGFTSECVTKEVLVDRYPRDSFTLATKLHSGFVNCKEDRDKIFDQQREKTGADYFDYYLLHGISIGSYDKYLEMDCFNWLREKKRQGLVRHIGFSYHDGAALLDRILTEQPDMEFVQLQLNYLDWENKGIQSRECYETAKKHGVPVIVMEPVKGGTLASVPEKVERYFKEMDASKSVPSWAIRFAASLDNVMMVLSGMSSMEQMEDNLSFMTDFAPLSETEMKQVLRAADLINENIVIPCTECAYCVDGCPMNIPIPKYFSLYNADKQETEEKGWLPQGAYYENLTHDFGKASDCVSCGQCEGVCPQHLPITEHLKTVAEHFEQ